MQLNADFDTRAAVHAGALEWVPSPTAGVDRRMLDRVGAEVARATSIVRYAPNSRFPAHVHGGGEEFLVLSGVFEDEHGAYPAGSYIRNPPTSRHTPGSSEGCEIFVKLWQFDPQDRCEVRLVDTISELETSAVNPQVQTRTLHHDEREHVRIEQWNADARVTYTPQGGLELLVLDGSFVEEDEQFVRHSWLRLPAGSTLDALAGANGARLWVKEGHLRNRPPLPTAAC